MKIINDLQIEINQINRDKKRLREFGFLVGGLFVLLGFFLGGRFLVVLGILGGLLIAAGLLLPRLLLYLYLLWMGLAIAVGFFVSRIILAIIFYLLLTPIGLLSRLFGRDPLNQKIDKGRQTYWIKYSRPYDAKDFEQMY